MSDMTTFSLPNYVGELFIADQKTTPFLSMTGGLSGGKKVNAWEYPNSVEETIGGGTSQPDITETASMTAPTPSHITPEQTTNVCQIYQEAVSISYGRMSDNSSLSGLSILGTNEITDPFEHQKQLKLIKIARDVEYTFLNGVFQRKAAAVEADVEKNIEAQDEKASKTRGILTAISTNVVAAGSASLSRALINKLLRTMTTNGAVFSNPVLFVGALDKQNISAIYGASPLGGNVQSREYGGVNIQTILTDFAELGVVYDPFMPSGTAMIADLTFCTPTFLEVPGKGYLFYEDLDKVGAKDHGQLYGQIGLAYGPENYHGKITGLASE